MYSYKIFIVLCVVGAVSSDTKIKYKLPSMGKSNMVPINEFKVIDSIHDEPACTSQGGVCTLAADCPAGHLLQEKGLCPAQRSQGVECCYGLSVKETRCEKRGGICQPGRDPCNKVRIFTDATDCPKDTTCCILVA